MKAATAALPQDKKAAEQEVKVRQATLSTLVKKAQATNGSKVKRRPVPSTVAVDSSEVARQKKFLEARISAVKQEIVSTQTAILRLNPNVSSYSIQKARLQAKLSELNQKLENLRREEALLNKGKIFRKPPVLRSTPLPRPALAPAIHAPQPSKDVAVKTLKLIATRSPRLPGESAERYRLRLMGLTQRSLVRWQHASATPEMVSSTEDTMEQRVRQILADPSDLRYAETKSLVSRLTALNDWLRANPTSHPLRARKSSQVRSLEKQLYALAFSRPAGPKQASLPGSHQPRASVDSKTGELTIAAAVEETLAQDEKAVTAESAAGGLAEDPATAPVESIVEQVADAIDDAVNATTETQTEEQLVADAEGEVAELMEDGEQVVDASEVPLYKRPVVVVGAIAALWWFGKKRGLL